ncbi:MAG: hypothetical protein DRP68_02715 [Candidatus Omnitrophota bacterium]|nr:MAG: hypothetical protein DRP68_02715 [Candidatus Omnitrophota bacterium]
MEKNRKRLLKCSFFNRNCASIKNFFSNYFYYKNIRKVINKERIAILLIFLFFLFLNCFAYREDYPPFPFKSEQNLKFLKASKIIEDEGKVMVDNNITVESLRIEEEGFIYQVTIAVDKKIIFKNSLKWVYGIYYADLDNNDYKDFIIFSSYGGCGLAAFISKVDILFQTNQKEFSHLTYDTYQADLKDFVDLDNDGKYEIIYTDFYYGRKHNYWVYSIYEIRNDRIQLANDKYNNFPKFIWYTYKPNDKDSKKITTEEKSDYLSKLNLYYKFNTNNIF